MNATKVGCFGKCFSFLFYWLLLFVVDLTPVHAQFFTNIQVESGVTHFNSESYYWLTRPRLNMGQQINSAKLRFNWNFTYQPEIFDFSSSISTQRFKGQFALSGHRKNLGFNLSFRTRYQKFTINRAHFAWQSSELHINLKYWTNNHFFWSGQVTLWYRDTNDFDRQKLNANIWQVGPTVLIKSVLIQLQIYHERYFLKPLSVDLNGNKKGQRSGFLFYLGHSKRFLFSLTYQFLFHFHQNQLKPTFDHQMSLLLGRWLTDHWSFFFLIDYNKLGKPRGRGQSWPALLYTPVNSANRFYFKISNDLTKKMEWYLKFGYENEELIHGNNRWQFWQMVIGLSKKFGN